MQDLDRLRVALRVLAAVTEFREPEDADVQILRSYVPVQAPRAPDELACEVIQQALKARRRISESMAEKV